MRLSGLGPIPPQGVRRVLEDTAVEACSAHEDADELLADPGRVAEKLHVYGCASVAYHHHHLEFQRLGRQTVMDSILEQVDPGLLEVELDTYWLQAGGVAPVQWIRPARRCSVRSAPAIWTGAGSCRPRGARVAAGTSWSRTIIGGAGIPSHH